MEFQRVQKCLVHRLAKQVYVEKAVSVFYKESVKIKFLSKSYKRAGLTIVKSSPTVVTLVDTRFIGATLR